MVIGQTTLLEESGHVPRMKDFDTGYGISGRFSFFLTTYHIPVELRPVQYRKLPCESLNSHKLPAVGRGHFVSYK